MKKRLTTLLLAGIAGSAMVMGASAADITADEILKNAAAQSAAVNEINGDVLMKVDGALTMADQAITLVADANVQVSAVMDPFNVQSIADLAFNLDMMGQQQDGDYHADFYVVPDENGQFVSYSGASDGETTTWTKSALGEEFSEQLKQIIGLGQTAPELPIEFNVSEDLADVDGIQCYELTSSLTFEDVMNVYNAYLEAYKDELPEEVLSQLPDEESLASIGSMLGGLIINVTIDVANDNYEIEHLRIDTEGSDFSSLGMILGLFMSAGSESEEMPSISLDVNDLFIECFYDYTTPVEIVVPDEAIANAVDAGDLDIAELAAESGL